jgi:hypothetical protein
MSNLYINVWPDASQTALGDIEDLLTISTLSGSNQISGGVSLKGTLSTKRVRLFAEVACWVTWASADAAAPDATGAIRVPLGAENPEYMTVPVGTRFAAITR